jgi:hypothetical protein
MVQMGLTEQEFIDFMDSEDETGGVYTKKDAISYCNLYFLVVILNPPLKSLDYYNTAIIF